MNACISVAYLLKKIIIASGYSVRPITVIYFSEIIQDDKISKFSARWLKIIVRKKLMVENYIVYYFASLVVRSILADLNERRSFDSQVI